MTTTNAIASRIAASRPGLHGIAPLTILAIIQALAQAAMLCFPSPEDGARYLSCADLRAHPFRRGLRQRKLDRAIRRECRARNIPIVHESDVIAAVRSECSQVSADVVANLYADLRAAKGDA